MSFLKKLLHVASSKGGSQERRQAYRVEIPSLRAKLSGKPISVGVRDISATGISLVTAAKEFKQGNTVSINLFKGAILLLSSLKIEVVRVDTGYVGARFVELTPQQDNFLHAVTLEEQKKQAERKKKAGESAAARTIKLD
ncbi:PilZ domain-containing protein [Desulfohalovibrio reitneri]|uniref:PilZ domain-containing protein n=1 Tax=Desulfohalovibrio reitneri TaxID=1307759 RepID=UPI0004A752EA|nr:PilZ domain-containing protein [Desulfohalovibrio reitneri]